jgi:hypothetical protein
MLYQDTIVENYSIFEDLEADVRQNYLDTEIAYQNLFLYWITFA